MDMLQNLFRSSFGNILQSRGNAYLSFDLCQRTGCVAQEVQEFARFEMRLPFGNVAGNRNRSSSDLVGKTVGFPARKAVTDLVHVDDQVHRLLPGYKILIVLSHTAFSGYWLPRYWVLTQSTVCFAVYPSRETTSTFTSLPFWSRIFSGPPSGATNWTFNLR